MPNVEADPSLEVLRTEKKKNGVESPEERGQMGDDDGGGDEDDDESRVSRQGAVSEALEFGREPAS